LEEFTGDKKPGTIFTYGIYLYILYIYYINTYNLQSTHATFIHPGWRGANQPLSMSVKCSLKFPMSSQSRRIPVVPVGKTGMIQCARKGIPSLGGGYL
jgi:hypothetical protein